MKVLYVTDNGCYYCNGNHYLSIGLYTIANRYANAFGKIDIYSRCRKVEKVPVGAKQANFVEKYIDRYSLKQVIFNFDKSKIAKELKGYDLVIARLPAFTGYQIFNCAQRSKTKYMSEVMGDPWDQYWNHGLQGKMVAPYMYFKMKQVLKKSNYALYVTEHFLQNRYPCNCPTISASNVSLNKTSETILQNRLQRNNCINPKNFKILTTASVDVAYKGHRFVIEAISKLKKMGINVTYYLAGSGNQEYLRKYINKYNVQDNVIFMGGLSHDKVFTTIDSMDFYIQPSLQEGLPRALIEALSRGIVCFGSNTAGIPELLEPEYVFKRGSSDAIVDVLSKIDSKDLNKNSKRNFDFSKKFVNSVLDERRNIFFQQIKEDISRKSN